MWPVTLKLKVTVYLALSLTVAVVLFSGLVIRHHRDELLQQAAQHVNQLSEVITKSTRYAMLRDQPSYVDKIIQDVGGQPGITKVRILSKDGRIMHSSSSPELGRRVDRKAEACFHCHRGETPLRDLPPGKRSRVFEAADGGRRLGSMHVIRNEPSCSNGGCHVHSPDQSVLGVLDIVYSLERMDRELSENTTVIAIFSVGFVLVASLVAGLLVHRMVYVPLRDLESGAARLAAGDLEQPIPVRGRDEFGRLAGAFNAMTAALRASRQELTQWAGTLEQKVEEKTGQLRLAQAEAARGERLASLGLLAAGIAHEINNPLTGVLTFSHLVRDKIPDDRPEAEDLDLIIRETKRCAAIIRRLLDFARERPPEMKFGDVNDVVRDTAALVDRTALFADVELVLDLDHEVPRIWMDEDLIKQVIMNMLVNAQHAMDGPGTITVTTRPPGEARRPDPQSDAVPMVELSVADTGCGIPEADLQRIFDPFFTSKGVGKGTGLGLSVSHGTVKAHGGAIVVESAVGEGTTFHIYLPVRGSGPEADGSEE